MNRSAPEVIRYRKFSHSSDVWAFAVLLWELYEYGTSQESLSSFLFLSPFFWNSLSSFNCQPVPYPSMSNSEVVEAILNTNYRLPKPKNCSEETYQIMLK